MSHKALKWALKRRVVPPHRALLLIHLAGMSNDSGEVNASQDRIAKASGVSRRAVIDHLNALVDDGLVIRQAHYRKNGRRAVNTYFLGYSNLFKYIQQHQKEVEAQELAEANHAL